jgi:hypothetical protein
LRSLNIPLKAIIPFCDLWLSFLSYSVQLQKVTLEN